MEAAIMVPGADGGTWEVRDGQRPVVIDRVTCSSGLMPKMLNANFAERFCVLLSGLSFGEAAV
jgi:hypothetical protein